MCRNCDTAIEVSEGDVARFRTNPVFACSVCQQDLSPRLAEMLGRTPVVLGTVASSRLSDPDEFTVPDDEAAFDGLPMGESFDDAAMRLKAVRNPAVAPVTRTPKATPIMDDPAPEDPSALALRIAGQAQAQALALAERAIAGASVEPRGSPDTAATEPGIPLPAGSPSTEVGVVPEEPENETTARARTENAEGSVAEPTLPSDGGDDDESALEHTASSVPEEPTPLVSALPDDERSVDITRTPESSVPPFPPSGVLPRAPANEATPSVSRGGAPVLVEDEPPREVTAKRSAPPPRIMRTTVPRTGTGPAGIGALGIRVVNSRAVVRPTSNGKSISVPPPNAETQVTAIELERPSAGGRAAAAAASAGAPTQPYPPHVPFSSPRAGTQQRRQNSGAPMWAMIGGGSVVLAILAVFGLRMAGLLGSAPEPTVTPFSTATPDLGPTTTPMDVIAVPTPIERHTPATPAPTPTVAVLAPQTPRATATPEATPAIAISTPVPRVSATPVATALVIAPTPKPTAAPTAKSSSTLAIEAARAKVAASKDYDGAMKDLYAAGLSDPAHMEELWGEAWSIGDRYGSRELKLSIAGQYLKNFPNGRKASLMKIYVERAEKASATPTAPP